MGILELMKERRIYFDGFISTEVWEVFCRPVV